MPKGTATEMESHLCIQLVNACAAIDTLASAEATYRAAIRLAAQPWGSCRSIQRFGQRALTPLRAT